jgi:hypothetical protein
VARTTEDPALLLQALDALIQIEATTALRRRQEIRTARILGARPEGDLRQRVGASDVARRVQKLS